MPGPGGDGGALVQDPRGWSRWRSSGGYPCPDVGDSPFLLHLVPGIRASNILSHLRAFQFRSKLIIPDGCFLPIFIWIRLVVLRDHVKSPAGFSVRKEEYQAMEEAILGFLRRVKRPVGFEELYRGVARLVPPALFLNDRKIRWYAKVVQRDLELTGRIERLPEPPVRLLVRS